ncbi:DUF4263 domain-containing protein [Kribbella sp. NBC_00709]|uniref:Shedu anti-phage system protein SduA domain-containing protein n=1 Tax=Kribbella sp. NBC_00709 TaxID=2975972 RepID=UPI002E2BDF9D|nr:Shedu anti-phage system protein SduA domain-containing protein [Kribbella sp. NBC_00709]
MGFEDEFDVWLGQQPTQEGHLGYKKAVVKNGPKAYKTVRLAQFGDSRSGEIKRTELRFATFGKLPDGGGYNFATPAQQWFCENSEIDIVTSFLNTEIERSGRYRIVDSEDPVSMLATVLADEVVDTEELSAALLRNGRVRDLLPLLLTDNTARLLAEQAAIQRRRDLLKSLVELVELPETTETDVQAQMGNEYWIFGGRYTGVAKRDLLKMDAYDIPLICADGSLHIVELKGPRISGLVRLHRSHWIVGEEVHEAVSQTMSYLRTLDETGSTMETQYRKEKGLNYDMRRNFATVVIGHPSHNKETKDEQIISEAIRTYNAHLSRVQVVTYQDLLTTAMRALDFEEETIEPMTTNTAEVDDPWAASPSRTDPWATPPADPWD